MKHIALLLGLSFAALAQQPSHRPEFVLGITVDELYKAFGMPSMYYDIEIRKYMVMTVEVDAARELGHRVSDVYTRKTASNTYEFIAHHEYDDRQSRLHPTKRVTSVRFELDRPVTDVKDLLADLPEAVRLCSKGCTILKFSLKHSDFIKDEELFVQPTNPSPEQLSEAARIEEIRPINHPIASFDQERAHQELAKPHVEGFAFPLEEGRIVKGSFETMTVESDPDFKPIDTWQPSPIPEKEDQP
jgi:hypothetical protein